MNWRTEGQKLAWNINSEIDSIASNLGDMFDSLVGGASAAVGDLLAGTSAVGINVNEIPNMQAAIKDYVKKLEAHLEKVRTDADTKQAFKGEYAIAITKYVESITLACGCVTSQLLKFSDQLKDIKEAYEKQDVELATKIKGTAADVEGSYQRYESQY